jgi:hypothetical protein
MDINKKYYKVYRMKNYFKNNNLLFFFYGVNKTPNGSLKQKMKNYNINFNKAINKIQIKTFKNSTISLIVPLINGSIFLATPLKKTEIFIKTVLITSIYPFFFTLAFRLNNKIYSVSIIKNIYSLNYFQNKQLLKQLCTTRMKQYTYENLAIQNNVARTHDFLLPKQTRYQTALYFVLLKKIGFEPMTRLNPTDLQSAALEPLSHFFAFILLFF